MPRCSTCFCPWQACATTEPGPEWLALQPPFSRNNIACVAHWQTLCCQSNRGADGQRPAWHWLSPRLTPYCAHCTGIVLLKNADLGGGRRLLPLDASAMKKVVVMGPHAKATEVLMGNYYGIPSRRIVSPLEAIQARLGSLLIAQIVP